MHHIIIKVINFHAVDEYPHQIRQHALHIRHQLSTQRKISLIHPLWFVISKRATVADANMLIKKRADLGWPLFITQ